MIDSDISSDFVNAHESDAISFATPRLPEISDFSRLERLRHEGTTCNTYKWEWCSRVYFVKRLKTEFLHSPQHRHAFEKEFELGSRLSHPSLPRYVDFRHTEQECYIVMDYIDGKTLQELWHKPITADRRATYKILKQLIDVLEYLHTHNIMHYDLTPKNVILTNGLNNVMLIDLDKAFHSAYAKTHGDTSRFGLATSDEISSDVDFRGIGVILSKGLWGDMNYGELKHFNDLCNKPGVTAEELREALAHKYDDVYVGENKCIEGRLCDGYEGDWQLSPVMIKRLHSGLRGNKYYLDKFKAEFDTMYECNDPTFSYYLLIRETQDDCFIVIEPPEGMSVSEMLAKQHPWIYDLDNIQSLLRSLLSSFFYLWEEGLDYMNFAVEDIFVNPANGEIHIANFREILDTTIVDTENRWAVKEEMSLSTSGEVICRKVQTFSYTGIPLELPHLARIIDQLDERGVDMDWWSEFKSACTQGKSYRELSKILDNSKLY